MSLPSALRDHWLAIVLAVAVVVLLALSCVVRRGDGEDGSDKALDAARQQARAIFSLDYRKAEQDVERVLEHATGSFEREYAAEQGRVVADSVKRKLVVTAAVVENGAALEYLREERAQVLVALDVETTVDGEAAADRRYRARIELTRVDDKWLVSDVDEVG